MMTTEKHCCPEGSRNKRIKIEFLYLDLSVCSRCQGTESSLDQAIEAVKKVLEIAGYPIAIERIHVETEDQARKHRFYSSPTIRINGRDITPDVTESDCKDCGDLCGESVDCRTWIYEGVEYDQPPKAMVVNAILKAIYGSGIEAPHEDTEYIMPENLKAFYRKTAQQQDKMTKEEKDEE